MAFGDNGKRKNTIRNDHDGCYCDYVDCNGWCNFATAIMTLIKMQYRNKGNHLFMSMF